jgi:uncharacterized membrane protein
MISLLILLIGLMAGVYFTFSAFVMKALSQQPPLEGAAAMNRINQVILNSLFMPVFLTSTLGVALLAGWAVLNWESNHGLMLVGALFYLVGMFGVTVFGNVPLNNRLNQDADNPDTLTQTWADYQHRWTRLNHLRTLSCVISLGLLLGTL